MSLELKVVLIVAGVLALVVAAFLIARFAKGGREETENNAVPPATGAENAPEEVEREPEKEPEQPVAPENEPAAEETAVTEIGEIEDDEDDREIFNRTRTFVEKMLELDVRTQEYYDALNNEFISYRKVHQRISKRCVSYRFGRKLIAKISARGRTMKMHLALSCGDFAENIYFQKDLSDVKSYAETPFTVKVKSDRGLKKAIELIGALAEKEGLEKKTRFTAVDSMEEVRAIFNESKAANA